MAKLTAADLDKMAGFDNYEVPEPREAPKVVAEFENQKKAAEFLKDVGVVMGQGAAQGFGDEAIAGLKTGSVSSPEYISERNKLRNAITQSRENVPGSSVFEALGSVASTAAVPVMKAYPVAKELVSAGIQGFGEAEEMKDVPGEVATSMAIQGGMELGGKALKKVIADDSTKILSRSIGAKSAQTAMPQGRAIQDSVERLNKAGFFKQGEVAVDPMGQSFKRANKNLAQMFKPQSLDTLYERATNSLSTLKDVNNSLIKGKKIKVNDFMDALDTGVQEMSYDPKGFDIEARLSLAEGVSDTILKDLTSRGKFPLPGNNNIDAAAVEEAKKALDAHVGSNAFKKKAEDLGLNPEAITLFRRKLDELVDQVGGPAYKKNNDLMSDIINVKGTIENKLNREYIDTGSQLIDNRGWKSKLMDAVSPTPVDIMRSDLATMSEGKVAPQVGRLLKRVPVESFTEDNTNYYTPEIQQPKKEGMFNKVKPAFPFGREPQSTMITPKQMINYRIPANTEAILADKERVIAKLVQNNVPDEMVNIIAQALDGDSENIGDIAPLIMTQFPTIFEKSKYKVFDGKFIDPNDKARVSDAISKRDDLNSIQRAKMINQINKKGEMPQGL